MLDELSEDCMAPRDLEAQHDTQQPKPREIRAGAENGMVEERGGEGGKGGRTFLGKETREEDPLDHGEVGQIPFCSVPIQVKKPPSLIPQAPFVCAPELHIGQSSMTWARHLETPMGRSR
jgi:hypothetical protein